MNEPAERPSGAEPFAPAPRVADSSRPAPRSADPLPPRPQYGEYASPEEQRARIRNPNTPAALDAGPTPAPPAKAPRAASAGPRTADRVVTIALLAYGLVNVALTGYSLIDFPTVATMSMRMIGITGDFTNIAQGRLFGAIAAVALVVGWAITALFSWRRIRARKVAWWLPLVGAAVTYLIVYALLLPAILGDPAFIDYVRSATP